MPVRVKDSKTICFNGQKRVVSEGLNMKKVPFYLRADIWQKVIQSGQIALGAFQGVSMIAEKEVQTFNIIVAGVQASLGIVSLWTTDSNKNNVIDIAEPPQVDITITSTDNAQVNVKQKTKQNE